MKSVYTLIRRRVLPRLIFICPVCQLPFGGFIDLNGLKGENSTTYITLRKSRIQIFI